MRVLCRIKTSKTFGNDEFALSQGNLSALPRMLVIVAPTFDKKIFENESVFPAIERSADSVQSGCVAVPPCTARYATFRRSHGSGIDFGIVVAPALIGSAFGQICLANLWLTACSRRIIISRVNLFRWENRDPAVTLV